MQFSDSKIDLPTIGSLQWLNLSLFIFYSFCNFFLIEKFHNHKNKEKEAREMAELLRAFVALAEN